jgi:hypothetical protein
MPRPATVSQYLSKAHPDGNSAKWPESFRCEYDKKLMEMEGARQLLLMLARKL